MSTSYLAGRGATSHPSSPRILRQDRRAEKRVGSDLTLNPRFGEFLSVPNAAGMPSTRTSRSDHLTFRGNLRETRYGWLRLTPAYSVHLVDEILQAEGSRRFRVLDPFCGTGTTALVCAERGVPADTTDINPFLIWLALAKTRRYSGEELESFAKLAAGIARSIVSRRDRPCWTPDLYQIEKWWDRATLIALGRAMAEIRRIEPDAPPGAVDLLKVSFCQAMIEHAAVSFGHQSMSFRKRTSDGRPGAREPAAARVVETWSRVTGVVREGAALPVAESARVLYCDARELGAELEPACYGSVITSPPYPNRMSYVRELRPYMYWLGYLADRRAAGELDWQAIGGTWGAATSNLARWSPARRVEVPYPGFDRILELIGQRSDTLARYVSKYFYDMVLHIRSLLAVLRPGGTAHYIVGNSKFYDVLLPVEAIFGAIFRAHGFRRVAIRTLRKRTSKKELFEYVVSAEKPGRTG